MAIDCEKLIKIKSDSWNLKNWKFKLLKIKLKDDGSY